MSKADRLPVRRPFSHGSSVGYPVSVSRKLVRAEEATAVDIALHELDTIRREVKAGREAASNRRVVECVTSAELDFYDKALDDVGSSPMKQRRLADRMALFVALNDDVVERFRR